MEFRLRPEAELDLADTAIWYQAQGTDLGHRFLDEVLATFSTIQKTPRIYPIVYRNTRRALIRRFPFAVFFRIGNDVILVLAVMHGSRHPRRWKSRA